MDKNIAIYSIMFVISIIIFVMFVKYEINEVKKLKAQIKYKNKLNEELTILFYKILENK